MRLSIAARLFSAFVVVQLIGVGAVLGWYFYSVQGEIRELAGREAEAAVLRALESTESYLQPAETAAQQVRRLMQGGVLSADDPAGLERYFYEQLRSHRQFSGMFAGFPDGRFHFVIRDDKIAPGGFRSKSITIAPEGRRVVLVWRDQDFNAAETTEDPEDTYDPRKRGWYEDAVEKRDLVWSEPYIFFTAQKPGITAAAPVIDPDGNIAGVIGVDIEIGEVSTFLSRLSLGLGGPAFIMRRNGDVLAQGTGKIVLAVTTGDKTDLRFRRAEELEGVAGGAGATLMQRLSGGMDVSAPMVWQYEDGGTSHQVGSAQLSNVNWPWVVNVMVPEEGLARSARTTSLFLVVIAVMAVILACAIGYAISRRLGGSLAALKRNADWARHGNVELMQPVDSGYAEIDDTDAALQDLAARRRAGNDK